MTRGSVIAVGALVAMACNPPNVAGRSLRPVATGDAFPGVRCGALRPQTEPDLMAWDAGERANLNEIRQQGLVVVRYKAKGCDVELEVLSNCDAPGKYTYYPYTSTQSVVANNANELFGKLPLGAAHLESELHGERALRTDYDLVGLDAIPIGTVIRRTDLRGRCDGATHVVSKIYLGGFTLDAGQKATIAAAANLFGASAGGNSHAGIEQLQQEGDPKQCAEAAAARKENPGCSVPLRIALLPIGAPQTTAAGCARGFHRSARGCVPDSPPRSGKVAPGRLGVTVQARPGGGVLIAAVEPGGAADKAGLQRGDLVLQINGRSVDSTGAFAKLIAEAGAYADVDLYLLRAGGQRRMIRAKLGAAPTCPAGSYKSGSGCVRVVLIDGRYEVGRPGVVGDKKTGLSWQASSPPQQFGGGYTWHLATEYCAGLRLAGHADWRLPTITELQSIYSPLDARAFPDGRPTTAVKPLTWSEADWKSLTNFWSSTAGSASNGLLAGQTFDALGNRVEEEPPSFHGNVRCVRSSASGAAGSPVRSKP